MTASLSPEGRFVAYYNGGHWHLYDSESGETRNLTENLPVLSVVAAISWL